MENALSVTNLVKKYALLTAVDGISFNVKKGECCGILGPNGAGKTSAIKVLYGYLPKTSGEIFFSGRALEENLLTIKMEIGVVEQENCLDTDLTVMENLTVYAGFFGIPKRVSFPRAAGYLERFGLSEKQDTVVENLSGGMKRRLMVARALINEPEIIILDEPTIGLDPQSRHMIWDMLLGLKKEKRTILLTTHYMEEAERLCDRIIVMDRGRIISSGSPSELIEANRGKFVLEIEREYLESENFLKESGLEYELSEYRVFIYGLLSPEDERIKKILPETGKYIFRHATLEDVFLKLTGRQIRE